MPAKAGIQNHLKLLDSRLRGNDVKGRFKTFYETINIQCPASNVEWFISLLHSAKSERFDVGRSSVYPGVLVSACITISASDGEEAYIVPFNVFFNIRNMHQHG